jgi:hypothetical protein
LKHTPIFSGEISRLAAIMGEAGKSGHSLGLDEIALACVIPRFPNDFQMKNRERLRFEIRADYGRFYII